MIHSVIIFGYFLRPDVRIALRFRVSATLTPAMRFQSPVIERLFVAVIAGKCRAYVHDYTCFDVICLRNFTIASGLS